MNRPLLGFLLALVGIGAAQAQQTNTFIPSGNYTSLTAGATSTNVALPANSPAIQLENMGATAVSCSFGMSSADAVATPLQLTVQPGGQKTVGVPQGMTWVACIDQTGSASNVVIVAGGNGSGSDVGSNVITTIPSGTQNVNIVSPLGSAVSAASIPVVIASDQLAVAVKQASAANLNATVIGTGTFQVQATDNIAQINTITALAGAGATGPGSLRTTTAQDVTTIAGSAPGVPTTPVPGTGLLVGYKDNSGNFQVASTNTTGFPVQFCSGCQAFSVAGGISNASSAVASSGINVGTISYLYGYNSTTWDQLQVDASKNLKVNVAAGAVTATPLALTPVTASTALESNHVLKGSANGTFYGVQVNTTSSAEWVMLFNATSLPANGAVLPIAWWQVPINTTLSISESPAFTMSTGIVIACSTTGPFTLTASALCTFAGGLVQ